MSQTVTFEKIVPEGKALARVKGKALFAIGPLPGEKAEVNITRQKRNYDEAVLKHIVTPSVKRTGAAESHSLSCSPWQGVDYDYQLELKTAMLSQAYQQHHLDIKVAEFVGSSQITGYRNRLDFTLARLDGKLKLAFHARGSWQDVLPLPDGCVLGTPSMNAAALDLVRRLDDNFILAEDSILTVRQSHSTGEILTILTTLVKKFDWAVLAGQPNINLVVVRPANGSNPGKLIYAERDPELIEKIGNLDIAYPYDGFFQTNPKMFNKALDQIVQVVGDANNVIELYSGVGAIGLPLATSASSVTGVEIVPSAVKYARRNSHKNNITNYNEILNPAEKMDFGVFKTADVVVLDPPRAGLHPRVVRRLIEYRPKRIVYLSCNPVTQARDIALLSEFYTPSDATGFDFYPQTLHLESLVTLALKRS
jgi:23S rRNA (uracil1939-C5)-methyltransferase